ncbi:MAG TPA: AAA family ATPase [Polyangiaceae bacterium]|nr:AAA family ATPase [Polyangiaceae bacterium]
MPPADPFLKRIRLKNYRSIAACDVELGRLTFLVGPNGSGKSNFVDALRFTADSLNSTIDHALRERGGVGEVVNRRADSFSVGLDLTLRDGTPASFAFEVRARDDDAYDVSEEECRVGDAFYHVKDGELLASSVTTVMPPPMADRLYLVHASGLADFRPAFDALTSVGAYNLNPSVIREPQHPDRGELLSRDGRNLASVVAHLERRAGGVKRRIEEYLGLVVPGVVGFGSARLGPMDTLVFHQEVEGAREPRRLPAMSMSDGTLRTVAVLVALFQARVEERIALVAIEEPETALHPAAAGVLRDCLREACRHVQVIVTSHSADLLDDADIDGRDIRAVESRRGRTIITPLDEVSRSALLDKLYTPGELLRANQLRAGEPESAQLDMFEGA